MRTIYKYDLGFGVTQVEVPGIFRVLYADIQKDNMCVWIEVEVGSTPTRALEFIVIGTGHEIPKGEYLNTIMDKPFVWHVYWR